MTHNEARPRDLWVIGEIAAEAAHELRNALAVIAASAELLRMGGTEAQREGHIAKIQRNARVAQSVLDALMALARGDELNGGPVSLVHAMADARLDVRGSAQWVDVVSEGLMVPGSEILLSRMLRVLYENAIQAGATRVDTRATAVDAHVIIDVTDDGPGVPSEARATLFDPLVTTKRDGTGLGLALARRVARAHGGEIELVSSDRGAAFRITLPTR